MNETLKQTLLEKLEQARSAEELQALVSEAGADISLDEAYELFELKSTVGDGSELSDGQLDAATGGIAWTDLVWGKIESFFG